MEGMGRENAYALRLIHDLRKLRINCIPFCGDRRGWRGLETFAGTLTYSWRKKRRQSSAQMLSAFDAMGTQSGSPCSPPSQFPLSEGSRTSCPSPLAFPSDSRVCAMSICHPTYSTAMGVHQKLRSHCSWHFRRVPTWSRTTESSSGLSSK